MNELVKKIMDTCFEYLEDTYIGYLDKDELAEELEKLLLDFEKKKHVYYPDVDKFYKEDNDD